MREMPYDSNNKAGVKVLVRLLASCGRNRGRQQLDQMPEEEGLLLEYGLCCSCTSDVQYSAAQLYGQTMPSTAIIRARLQSFL